MTREQAKTAGLKRYQGEPCRKGHAGWRYVDRDACIQCKVERARKSREKLSAQGVKPTPLRKVLVMAPGFVGPAPRTCEWIEGDPRVMRHKVDPHCGKPTLSNSAFCGEHHKRCYTVRVR